ncbi:hypothetical protein PG989_002961 [Apiospora arundinis]|uniref:Brct domain containing protein n=1 Tax=Apiospora arundinis TaxID=335852 RepID=A0ABR2I1U8_9PEZI
MSLVTQPKPIFNGLVIAITHDFHKSRPDFTEVDIARWVKNWGGRFSPDLDDSVTHLLALSQDLEPKNRSARVNSALKRKKLSIVHLDWFEDCFIHERKLNVKTYLLASGGRSIAETTKAKSIRAQKKVAKENEMTEKLAREYVDPKLFHAYMDETCFTYEIILTRGDNGERYQVTLFESNAKPHMYQYGHIYSPSKSSKKFVYNRMAGVPPAGTSFSSAFIEYKRFFERETGVGWDDRVAAFHKGKGHAKGDGFVYELPSRGKPIGLIQGKVPDLGTIYGGASETLDGNADKSGSETAVDEVDEGFDDRLAVAAVKGNSPDDARDGDSSCTEREIVDLMGEPWDDGLAVAAEKGDDIDTDDGVDEDAGAAQAAPPVPAVPALAAGLAIVQAPATPIDAQNAYDSGVDDVENAGHNNVSTTDNVGVGDEGYSSV